MDHNFYEAVIKEIQEHIGGGDFDRAEQLVMVELGMPYIPTAVEMQLHQLKQEVQARRPLIMKQQQYSEEEILAMLHDTDEKQLYMIEYLAHTNIRDYLPLIHQFFQNAHSHLAENLMIDTLIRQGVREEFVLKRDGMELQMIPALLEIPAETDGFQEAYDCLNDWFESENPSFLMMAIELLLFQVYWKLPDAFSNDEAELLAESIAIKLFDELHDMEGKEHFIKLRNVSENKLFQIELPL